MSTIATAPPPRWAVRAAHAAPLVTLPSALWRVALVLGLWSVTVDGEQFTVEGWEIAYVLGLSVVSELTALLTIGLVRPWGERAPAWMPLIGGRTVPVKPVVAVAATGAAALMLIWGYALYGFIADGLPGEFAGIDGVVLCVAYAPLLAWGPLVAAVTYSYWQRRR